MKANIADPRHGFWFIRSEEGATRATFLVGSFVCIVAAGSAYALWGNPDKAAAVAAFFTRLHRLEDFQVACAWLGPSACLRRHGYKCGGTVCS